MNRNQMQYRDSLIKLGCDRAWANKLALDLEDSVMRYLRMRLKRLPRYPFHTWDRKDNGNHQELIGLNDAFQLLKGEEQP